jgi:hypothetical protein
VLTAIACDALSMLIADIPQPTTHLASMREIFKMAADLGAEFARCVVAPIMLHIFLFRPDDGGMEADSVHCGMLFERNLDGESEFARLQQELTVTAGIATESSSFGKICDCVFLQFAIALMVDRNSVEVAIARTGTAFTAKITPSACDVEILESPTPKLLCEAMFNCGRRFNMAPGKMLLLNITRIKKFSDGTDRQVGLGHMCCGLIPSGPFPQETSQLILTQMAIYRHGLLGYNFMMLNMMSNGNSDSFMSNSAFKSLHPDDRQELLREVESGAVDCRQAIFGCNGDKFTLNPRSVFCELLQDAAPEIMMSPGESNICILNPAIITPRLIAA